MNLGVYDYSNGKLLGRFLNVETANGVVKIWYLDESDGSPQYMYRYDIVIGTG